MRDPNDEPHFYQTGALSEKNIILIADALRERVNMETASNSPDLQKVDDLIALAEHFEDAEGNLIPVDGPDTVNAEEEELEVEDEDDEEDEDEDGE